MSPTYQQVEQYIKCADLSLGHVCTEAWVETCRRVLRGILGSNGPADNELFDTLAQERTATWFKERNERVYAILSKLTESELYVLLDAAGIGSKLDREGKLRQMMIVVTGEDGT